MAWVPPDVALVERENFLGSLPSALATFACRTFLELVLILQNSRPCPPIFSLKACHLLFIGKLDPLLRMIIDASG